MILKHRLCEMFYGSSILLFLSLSLSILSTVANFWTLNFGRIPHTFPQFPFYFVCRNGIQYTLTDHRMTGVANTGTISCKTAFINGLSSWHLHILTASALNRDLKPNEHFFFATRPITSTCDAIDKENMQKWVLLK